MIFNRNTKCVSFSSALWLYLSYSLLLLLLVWHGVSHLAHGGKRADWLGTGARGRWRDGVGKQTDFIHPHQAITRHLAANHKCSYQCVQNPLWQCYLLIKALAIADVYVRARVYVQGWYNRWTTAAAWSKCVKSNTSDHWKLHMLGSGLLPMLNYHSYHHINFIFYRHTHYILFHADVFKKKSYFFFFIFKVSRNVWYKVWGTVQLIKCNKVIFRVPFQQTR